MLSRVQLFVTPWTVACQTPLSVEFSRQEYWKRLPFPTPGDFSHPEIELESLASPALAGGFFTPEPPGKPKATMPQLKQTNQRQSSDRHAVDDFVMLVSLGFSPLSAHLLCRLLYSGGLRDLA